MYPNNSHCFHMHYQTSSTFDFIPTTVGSKGISTAGASAIVSAPHRSHFLHQFFDDHKFSSNYFSKSKISFVVLRAVTSEAQLLDFLGTIFQQLVNFGCCCFHPRKLALYLFIPFHLWLLFGNDDFLHDILFQVN